MPVYEVEISGGVVGPPGPKGEPGVPPLTTADTATVDLSGAGTVGDPLKADVKPDGLVTAVADTATVDLSGTGIVADPLKADVVPGSYPIVTSDTATVDITGAGTTASPLKADVLPAGLPAVTKADSAEVALTGDGKTTPLSAALTGTRTGDWAVPSGNLTVGLVGDTNSRIIWTRRRVAPDEYATALSCGGAMQYIAIYKNDVLQAAHTFLGDGSIAVSVGSVARPVPFATWCGTASITLAAAVGGSATAINFPTGRFTVSPIIALQVTGSGVFVAYASALSATSITVAVRNVDNAPLSLTVGVHITAIQMTPTTAGG